MVRANRLACSAARRRVGALDLWGTRGHSGRAKPDRCAERAVGTKEVERGFLHQRHSWL